MKRTSYRHIKFYKEKLKELKLRGMDFEVTKTSYTRKIKTEQYTIIYNEAGKGDRRSLHLINNVRSDAKKYLESGANLRDTNINFFHLFNRPVSDKVMSKIDIKAAYWNYAFKRGIVSVKTNKMFLDYYEGENYKTAKKARLKALGSLSTTKQIINYIDGKADYENVKVITEDTKDLYMEICRGVDDLMKECEKAVESCCFYYWDCMFIPQRFEKDAIDFFVNKGYDVSVGHTKLEMVEVKDIKYLISTTVGEKDKVYMTRQEDKKILDIARTDETNEISEL